MLPIKKNWAVYYRLPSPLPYRQKKTPTEIR